MADQRSVGGLFGLLKGVIDNPIANTIGGGADLIGNIGQYFGLDPKIANEIDVARNAQLLIEGKETRTQFETKVVEDFVDGWAVKKMEDSGMNPMLASLLGKLAEMGTGFLAKPLAEGIDGAVAGELGKLGITGGHDANSPGAPSTGGGRNILGSLLGA